MARFPDKFNALSALIVGALIVFGYPSGLFAAQKPQRIISLNLCSDQLLYQLGVGARIVAYSHLATNPQYSMIAGQVKNSRTVRGSAEELVALRPDLVIAGPYSTKTSVAMVRGLGKRVMIMPIATSFSQVRSNIKLIADAVGEPGRGAALIRAFDQRLALLKLRVSGPRPRAAVYYTNSVAQISGSIESAVMKFSGYRNIADLVKLSPRGTLTLERLLMVAPDMIVLGHRPENYPTVLADNLRHPALGKFLKNHAWVAMPERLWICGTPTVLDAAERLIAAWENSSKKIHRP